MGTLFCDITLAHRIERAETRLIVDAGQAAQARSGTDGFAIPVAGGRACFAEPDSPFNKVVGLGFGGVPDSAELDAIEQAFAARGAPTQVELAHLAESAVGALLSDRGYRLESFENVLGIALASDPELAAPAGIEVRLSTGAATTPAHRRHGVQTALLTARLADARTAGCDVAVITTQPGSKSQQNAQRRGFELLYTRATLVKHP